MLDARYFYGLVLRRVAAVRRQLWAALRHMLRLAMQDREMSRWEHGAEGKEGSLVSEH